MQSSVLPALSHHTVQVKVNLQIDKWFLEKRTAEEDNFPELPSEEEGGSKALSSADTILQSRGQTIQIMDPKKAQKAQTSAVGKPGMGSISKGTEFLRLHRCRCCPYSVGSNLKGLRLEDSKCQNRKQGN